MFRKAVQRFPTFILSNQFKSDGLYRTSVRTKVDKFKPATTVEPEANATKKLTIQITEDGIFKSKGNLLDANHTIDGLPIYPGKHKFFRLNEGDYVKVGHLICYQKKLNYHPGLNVGIGLDLTLYAYEEGTIYITWEKVLFNWENKFVNEFYLHEKDMNVYRPYYHVIAKDQPKIFKLVERL